MQLISGAVQASGTPASTETASTPTPCPSFQFRICLQGSVPVQGAFYMYFIYCWIVFAILSWGFFASVYIPDFMSRVMGFLFSQRKPKCRLKEASLVFTQLPSLHFHECQSVHYQPQGLFAACRGMLAEINGHCSPSR